MQLYLRDEMKRLWQGMDAFNAVEQLTGEVYRNKEGRTTLQTEINGKSYFLKIHRGIGWKEITKNLLQFRLPIIGASNEYLAAKKLADLGVDTLTTAAFGKKGLNLGCRKATFMKFWDRQGSGDRQGSTIEIWRKLF